MNHGDPGSMSEGVHVQGIVNSLGDGTANVTHEPIPDIGWPAMTMDLPLLEGAEVAGVGEGDAVTIMLEQGPDGMYGIRALTPAP
jgi:Cu(I)/Ag(I) efflux system protein CusF